MDNGFLKEDGMKIQGIYQTVKAVFQAACTRIEVRRAPSKMGDYAVNCSGAAEALGQDVQALAATLAEELSQTPEVEEVSTAGAFVNFRLKPETLFGGAFETTASKNAAGAVSPERIMVEYSSPNTNKPLHLGHLRNNTLGSSLANILAAAGHNVTRACLVNDRGVHICKSMLAWQRWGNGLTPKQAGMKGDHFVGEWYVKFTNEARTNAKLEEDIAEMLRKWEAGDPATLELWRTMNAWVYEGFATTYTRYGYRFDKVYYESDLYKLGKDLVQMGLDGKVFQTNSDGNIVFRLTPKVFGLSKEGKAKFATVIRGDGTSVYLTQDIGTAARKVEEYMLDRSIYVVGNEQDHHFAVLFAILKSLGYDWAKKCYHLSYAMVELPSGRMKSREGTVVDADDLLDGMVELASDAVREKHSKEGLSEDEVARRAECIAVAAIKFYLLRFGSRSKIKFDPEKSLAFEGDTGPYCQYAYARACNILAKAAAEKLKPSTDDYTSLTQLEERTLALDLLEIPTVIAGAAESYDPMAVATHALRIARDFSVFYQRCPVIAAEAPTLISARLALVQAAAEGLKWTLSLLGIDVLESM